MDGWVDRCEDRIMDERIGGRKEGRMDEWMDG